MPLFVQFSFSPLSFSLGFSSSTKLHSMANPNQSVRTCILKVDLKCCTGCQKKTSMKLQSISGVNEVEYDSEKGLMTVTGHVEPMALVRKLTKCGKKTELFSVKYQLDDDDLNSDDEDDTTSDSTSSTSYPDPKTGLLKKPSLIGCFSTKSKVVQPLPMRNRKWPIPSKFPPGFGFPFPNATTSSHLRHPMMPYPHPMMPYPHPMMPYPHPMMPYPHPMMPYPPMMQQQPPPMMQQQPPPMMQQQPLVLMTGAAMPYNVNMFQPANQHYFMSKQAQTVKVNPKLHYQ